jgi:acetyl esterase/lipase
MSRIAFISSVLMLLMLHQACSQEVPEAHEVEQALKAPRGFRSEGILKAAYALRLLKLIETEPTVPENIEVHKDIVYKQVDSISLQLDIYKQKNLSEAAPVLIFIHGGGWSKGKRSDYLPYLLDYAQKGYVTVTVSYRLSGVAHFPAAVEDVQTAVQCIREHSSAHMINPEKIALIGGSAGGHLAMMVGFADKIPGGKVQAIVNLYGPADLSTEYARNRGECLKFLGQSYQEKPDLYSAASPQTYISGDDPPTLIFHGTIDSLVPVSQSDSLHQWLDRAGVPNEYHRLKGWPHTMDLSTKVNNYCQYYMDAFFKQYL